MPHYRDLLGGITLVDTGYWRPGLAACYLIEQNGQAAIVDAGTAHTAPKLLELLSIKRLAPEDVAYVLPTHVHLDHAGGAGELMRRLPNAKLVVHPHGARHMIDPSKLAAGARAVYGEAAFREHFGELVPVPKERVIVAEDGLTLDLDGRPLLFRDTPGHARHHYSVFDQATEGFFTGDTFGLSYPELDCAAGAFVFPTTTPVQFDPSSWKRSVDLLLSYHPRHVFLTHYGMVTDVEAPARDLCLRLDRVTDIARRAAGSQDRHERIRRDMTDFLLDELACAGCRLPAEEAVALFELDLELNAQGLEIWLDRGRPS